MEQTGGREGEPECSAPREHAALDGVVVHLCVCVCDCLCVYVCVGSVVSSLGPRRDAPLSKVFVVELTGEKGEGHSWWGHDSLCPPREPQHERWPVDSGSFHTSIFFHSYPYGSRRHKTE